MKIGCKTNRTICLLLVALMLIPSATALAAPLMGDVDQDGVLTQKNADSLMLWPARLLSSGPFGDSLA